LYFVADAAHVVGVQYNCVLYFVADAAHVGVQYNFEKVESSGVFDVWISGFVKEKSVAFQSICSIVQMQNTINDFLDSSSVLEGKGSSQY
jgi:glutamate mutase epsilon subunit